VADQADAKFLEILGGEVQQYFWLYGVITKRLFILFQAKATQPGRNLHVDLRRARVFLRLSAIGFFGPTFRGLSIGPINLVADSLGPGPAGDLFGNIGCWIPPGIMHGRWRCAQRMTTTGRPQRFDSGSANGRKPSQTRPSCRPGRTGRVGWTATVLTRSRPKAISPSRGADP
jgi:hypothetical protein